MGCWQPVIHSFDKTIGGYRTPVSPYICFSKPTKAGIINHHQYHAHPWIINQLPTYPAFLFPPNREERIHYAPENLHVTRCGSRQIYCAIHDPKSDSDSSVYAARQKRLRNFLLKQFPSTDGSAVHGMEKERETRQSCPLQFFILASLVEEGWIPVAWVRVAYTAWLTVYKRVWMWCQALFTLYNSTTLSVVTVTLIINIGKKMCLRT